LSQFERIVPDSKFNIFVIGPMGAAADNRSLLEKLSDRFRGRSPDRREEHIPNIGEAARQALKALQFRDDQFEIYIPTDLLGGSIVENVFSKIDEADFAIADISHRSANVFYEVAFFNALGTPVILLDLQGRDIPFYWRQDSIVGLKDFSVGSIEPQLTGILRSYFNANDPVQLSNNLITRFYGGIPLVDISAAAGVAVGFFENFARPVLTEGQGVLAIPENGVDHLLIIRPDRINDYGSDRDSISELLARAEARTVKAPLHPRRAVTAHVLERVIVDFPTPLYAMFRAPRYAKLRDRLRNVPNLALAARETAFAKMEAKLIASYFQTLDWLLNDETNLAKRKVSVVSLRDFRERGVDAVRR
jgi:hypothetical protein